MKVVEFLVKTIILLLILVMIGCLALSFAAIWHTKAGDELKTSDCAIVFGANPDNEDILEKRVMTAINLYNDGYFTNLILSGGGESRNTEAEIMRRIALSENFPIKQIYLDKDSESTIENIENSKEIAERIGCERVLAISSNYHLARIKLSAKNLGIKLYTYPADNSSMKKEQIETAKEVMKLVYYYLYFLF